MSIQPSAGTGSLNISQTAGFPPELSASMTGSYVKIGTILAPPVVIIFANQGTATVTIGIGPEASGGSPTITTWKTFVSGEIEKIDLRTNHGAAPNFTIAAGTTFWGDGASGTFSIAYLTAVP